MIFEEKYQPVIEDYTKEGKVSLFAVLKIFENAGSRHSDLAGDSVFKGNENTKAWVLTDWQVEILSYPSYGESIDVKTWSQELNSPVVASRDFLLYGNGRICAKGTTRWVLYDLKAGRPCRIEKELLEKYQPEDKAVFEDTRLIKITVPEQFQQETRIAVRRSDIDFNGHIHNLIYLDFALQALPENVYEEQKFKGLRISYKTAVKSEKEIICRYAQTGDTHIVGIYDTAGQLKTVIQFA